jgi:chromosome partitioning protein
MRQRSAKNLSYIGVLLTRYRGRANINQFLRDATEEAAGKIGAEYLGEIRDGVAVREAQSMRKNLFDYAPKAKPTLDYMTIYKKIIKGRK